MSAAESAEMSALVMSVAESAESADSAETSMKTTDSLSFSNPEKELTIQSKHLSLTKSGYGVTH